MFLCLLVQAFVGDETIAFLIMDQEMCTGFIATFDAFCDAAIYKLTDCYTRFIPNYLFIYLFIYLFVIPQVKSHRTWKCWLSEFC